MSLKQRAKQCSGYIPPSQYVPVYSRPHGLTSNAGRHGELSPVTPRPSLDDPYGSRTQRIHEAVKAWLESSPKSVIGGPLTSYRCHSPSSGSPPSYASSFDHTVVLPAGCSAPSSFDPSYSTPSDLEGPHDVSTAAVSPSAQKLVVRPQPVLIQNCDWETSGKDAVTPSNSAELFSSQVLSEKREDVARAEEEDGAVIGKSNSQSCEPAAGSLKTQPRQRRKHPMAALFEGVQCSENKTITRDTATTDEERRSGGVQENTAKASHAVTPVTDEIGPDEEAVRNSGDNFPVAAPVNEEGSSRVATNLLRTEDYQPLAAERVNPSANGEVGAFAQLAATTAANEMDLQVKPTDFVAVHWDKPALVSCGSEFSSESPRRRNQSSENSAGSATTAASHVAPQHMDDASSPPMSSAQTVVGEKTNHPLKPAVVQRVALPQQESCKLIETRSNGAMEKTALDKAKRRSRPARAGVAETTKNETASSRYKREENEIRFLEENRMEQSSMAVDKVEMELHKRTGKVTDTLQNNGVAKAEAMEWNADSTERSRKNARKLTPRRFLRLLSKSSRACVCN